MIWDANRRSQLHSRKVKAVTACFCSMYVFMLINYNILKIINYTLAFLYLYPSIICFVYFIFSLIFPYFFPYDVNNIIRICIY